MRFAVITLLIALLTALVIAIVVVPPEDQRQFRNRMEVVVADIRSRIEAAMRRGDEKSAVEDTTGEPTAQKTRLNRTTSVARKPTETRVVSEKTSAPRTGQPIGAWDYSCTDQPASARQCSISQRITDSANGQLAFSWTITADPEGNMSAVWRTRTGVKVSRGIVLEAGTPKPVALPYEDCTARFCLSRANLAPDFVTTLKSITSANATITTINGAPVTFDIDVEGLADGLTLLQ